MCVHIYNVNLFRQGTSKISARNKTWNERRNHSPTLCEHSEVCEKLNSSHYFIFCRYSVSSLANIRNVVQKSSTLCLKVCTSFWSPSQRLYKKVKSSEYVIEARRTGVVVVCILSLHFIEKNLCFIYRRMTTKKIVCIFGKCNIRIPHSMFR